MRTSRANHDSPGTPASLRRHIGQVGAMVVVCSFAAVMGLALIPSAVTEAGPTSVSARVGIGKGGTTVRIPPLGSISADTHPMPVHLKVDIEEVDIEELALLATSPEGRRRLRADIERDLPVLARRISLQLTSGGAVLGLLTALLVFHRNWVRAGAGALIGALAVATLLGATAISYDLNAFDRPSFHGPIDRARAVIDAVAKRTELLDEARSRYEIAAERMSELMVILGSPTRDLSQVDTILLHVSDIRANVLAFDFISQLAADFKVDAVIDTGDISSSELDTGRLSSFSDPIDRSLRNAISRLRVPYIFISGNHDSPATVASLERAANVEVLNDSMTSVGAVEIFGWGDPTYSSTPTPEDEKRAERAETAPRVAVAIRGTPTDVLAVHDSALAREAIGEVNVVLAGHTHEGAIEESDTTIMLTVGSTGATGLKSLTVEAQRTYDAQLLYFDGDVLTAVDYVRLTSFEGEFELERRTF